MNADHPPLATYILFTYNQRDYIESALKSAFSQTYSPLEIIISDDASTDGTAELILNTAESYQGPHKIIVQINESNLGIGRHVNQAVGMSQGEFLVFAAGDDISHADRVRRIMAARERIHPHPSAIFSHARELERSGHLGRLVETLVADSSASPLDLIGHYGHKKLLALGATGSYSPELIFKFEPLLDDLEVEDIPLAIRASLLNGIHYITEELVQYRINTSVWLPPKIANEGFNRHRDRLIRRITADTGVAKQILRDVSKSNQIQLIQESTIRFLQAYSLYRCANNLPINWLTFILHSFSKSNWKRVLPISFLFRYPTAHRLIFATVTAFKKLCKQLYPR